MDRQFFSGEIYVVVEQATAFIGVEIMVITMADVLLRHVVVKFKHQLKSKIQQSKIKFWYLLEKPNINKGCFRVSGCM